MRTVTININNRCPLRCRHCSLGFSSEFQGVDGAMSAEGLRRVIQSIDRRIYDLVLMAGGEPSLHPEVVRAGIPATCEAGLQSAIVTAPIWAKSPGAAAAFLGPLEGLAMLILSYDDYHLEFLRFAYYRNAALEALQRGMRLVFQVAYTREDERQRLVESLKGLARLAQVHPMRTVMVGNARRHDLGATFVEIHAAADLASIPRGCVLGNAFVDAQSRVHGCCWATASPLSPFTAASDGSPESLAAAFAELERRPAFQAVRASGFIGALTDRGRRAVVDLVRGESFSCECDLCLRVMSAGDAVIWHECAAVEVP